MKNSHQLLAAAAPIALIVASLIAEGTAQSAETVGASSAPRARVGRIPVIGTNAKIDPDQVNSPATEATDPAEVKPTPHIRTRTVATSSEDAVAVQEAQGTSTPSSTPAATLRRRIGGGVSGVNSTSPATREASPRIRTRTAVQSDDEAGTTQEAEAAPTLRRRTGTVPRVDTTSPATIETMPRIRSRVAAPVENEDAPEETTPRVRSRITSPQVDGERPAATDTLPRLRTGTNADSGGTSVPVPQTYQAQYTPDALTRQPLEDFVGKSPPKAVVLTPGSHQQILARYPGTRTLDLNKLTGNPKVPLGTTSLDFNPMLKNPKSLPNIAKALQAMPGLVEVLPPKMTATSIPQGVIVQTELTYRLKMGACDIQANRRQLASAGVFCFTYKDRPAREADFGNPGAVEFVKDPGLRSAALSNAKGQAKTNAEDIARHVSEFRAMLRDPAQRAQIEAMVGSAETNGLEQLDDTALAGKLINFHDATIVEDAYIPTFQAVSGEGDPLALYRKTLAEKYAKRLAAANAQVAAATEAKSYDLGTFKFITGFTLGSAHEWRQGISTTIKWCLVGCKKTYFAEAWAGFHYAFGLRFPMKTVASYNYNPASGGSASLTSNLTTFDGSAQDYREMGLPEDKIYSGQELVAEFGANAGVRAKLPIIGEIAPPPLDLSLKLTDLLPGRLQGGNLTPPMPGDNVTPDKLVLTQVDLLGERANLGFISAKVHPAVFIGIESSDMGLTVSGRNPADGFGAKPLSGGKQNVPLPMDKAQASSFTIGAPHYTMDFTLTPGLVARLSLNLAVWGANIDWDVMFPEAEIKVPAGGLTFTCHEGTVCDHDFLYSPEGKVSTFKVELKNWAIDFDSYWLPKCLDTICSNSVKLKRYDTLEAALAMAPQLEEGWKNGDSNRPPMQGQLGLADTAAQTYVDESKVRKAQKASDTSAAMAIIAQAYYTDQCKDSLCTTNVAALAAQMAPRAKEIAAAGIYKDPEAINKQVNQEFAPRFIAEINASKSRVAMKQAGSTKNQFDQMGGKKPFRPTGN
ncbi:MAG: hypothetical protein ACKOPO_10550 [Novosphingobium sp.]